MISIQGKGVSTGVAIGPLYIYRRAKSTIRRYKVEDKEIEWARFKAAQMKAIEQLGLLAEKARAEAGDDAADVGAAACGGKDVAGGMEEDVEMFGHDYVGVHFYHRVVALDAR